MRVLCIDDGAAKGWLTRGTVYVISKVISDPDGDFFNLAETGSMCWWSSRFRPCDDTAQFLTGAESASASWDNRKAKEDVK